MPKLIVIVGITGNQGGSIARRFLQDPNYTIRGLTRQPSSATAQALISQGMDLVSADLNDVASLTRAFHGANLIFTVTNYWEPFFTPSCRQTAEHRGISIRQYAGEIEAQQGRNMADATAATVDSLDDNGFIVSTLSHAGNCSGGKVTNLYHFDAKADVFPGYVHGKYPALASKMSCVHTGYFTSSYKLLPFSWLSRQADGSFLTAFPQSADSVSPHLFVTHDMGPFVYAVSQLQPGKAYIAAGQNCSWSEWMRIWSEVTGQRGVYKEITREELIGKAPDSEFAVEVAAMFEYSTAPGYDGGMKELLGPEEIRKVSFV